MQHSIRILIMDEKSGVADFQKTLPEKNNITTKQYSYRQPKESMENLTLNIGNVCVCVYMRVYFIVPIFLYY